jgi:hypothetical protein
MSVNVLSSSPRELILIVDPEVGLRVRGEEISSINKGVDVSPLKNLLAGQQAGIRPLFGESEEWLQHRTSFTKTQMGVGQPLDLSIFYKVTGSSKSLAQLASALRELQLVQSAYIKPGAELPFIDTGEQVINGPPSLNPTPDLTRFQEFLNPASAGGLDARYAWTKTGGTGKDVNIIDIEGAWRFSHEDLVENPSGCVGGVQVSKFKWRKHGTAVLGILGGDHNKFGIAGMCPDACVRTISIFGNSNGDPSPDWGIPEAIRVAADMLRPGDIILLELHQPGPVVNFQENETNNFGYIPVEWWPCNMAAILYAAARKVIVVEAGGNGEQNLDAEIYCKNPLPPHGPFPDWWRNPFKRDPIDTGAILVGAGLPPKDTHGLDLGPDRSRWHLSNFGKHVDTQAWGVAVGTCGGNNDIGDHNAGEDRHYTSGFSGTSSASALVAGVLGCLQGVLRAKGSFLEPGMARSLLQDNMLGGPQQSGPLGPVDLQHIGPRPDLRRLIDQLAPTFSLKKLVRALMKALLGQRLR